jgi:molecular chaperone GrpE
VTEPIERSTAEGFSVSDKRRIDPETFEVREQPPAAPAPVDGLPGAPDPEQEASDAVDARVAELTADVQRLQADFANYRRRTENNRVADADKAVAAALAQLLPVLDDVERARAHGDLEGPFKSVGEALEGTVSRLGMTGFGEPGEPFDPAVHQAIASETSAEVTEPTTAAVHQRGYSYAGRIVRPAVVTVAEPE